MAQTNARIVRMAELEIDLEQVSAYRRLLADEIEASVRVEPGVLMLCAVADKDRPSRLRILEVYADLDAYEAHLKAPHFLAYKTSTAGMVRSLDLIEGDAIALALKPELASPDW